MQKMHFDSRWINFIIYEPCKFIPTRGIKQDDSSHLILCAEALNSLLDNAIKVLNITGQVRQWAKPRSYWLSKK